MSTIQTNAIVDASGGNTATVNGVTPSTHTVKGRNLIINGAMQVAQRGTTFSGPIADESTLDRWDVLANVNGAGKVDYSQSTDSPDGFTNSIKLDINTAISSLGSSDYHIMRYKGVEQQDLDQLAWGTSNAKSITLSFWVKSNKTGTLVAEFQMNSVEASGASVELGKTYTINAADTWEYKTLTFPANTNHTSNRSANDRGVWLYMWIAAGSNYTSGSIDTDWGVNTNRVTGQDNYLDSTSNEIYFTGFKLEVGNNATEFDHRPYAEELAACQRYYYQISGTNRLVGYAFSWNSSEVNVELQLPQVMRVSPTVGFSNNANDFAYAPYNASFSTFTAAQFWAEDIGMRINLYKSGGGFSNPITQGQAGYVRMMNSTAKITVDAEL